MDRVDLNGRNEAFREEFVEVAVDDFLCRIDLVVLAKSGVESLYFTQGNLVELDFLVSLARRIEDVVVDGVRL